MSTLELFEKHFGKKAISVDLKHPNIEAFFNDLEAECRAEDKAKKQGISKSALIEKLVMQTVTEKRE